MAVHRAYSLLTVKAVDGERRLITGTASTPTPDRMGDIVEPLGVSFKTPLPLLLYHDSRKPVGWVKFQPPTKDGVAFEARLPVVEEPGTVRDRVEEAWTSIKTGLIAGVSIGFRAIEEAFIKETGAFRFIKSELLELSLVAIPANPDATISTIKALDLGLAAPGTESEDEPVKPKSGVSDPPRVVQMRRDVRPMTTKKTIADQITGWETTRRVKTDRMDDLIAKGGETGTTMDEAEREEHDTLESEVQSIDAQLLRLRAAEARQAADAVIVKGRTAGEAAIARSPIGHVTIEKKLPPGIQFAQYAMCVAAARGVPSEARDLAKRHYPDNSAILAMIEKAAVGAAAAVTSHWADDLVPYNLMNDFIEYLRPRTILGQFGQNGIPALNRVPFNTRVTGMSTGLTGNWVGEGLPIPLSKGVTFTTLLTWAKVAALAVVTKEEVRFSNPSAEEKIRNDIARSIIQRMDIDFVDPSKAAVANVSPASITSAIVATAPTGTTAAAFRKDLATILALFAANNLDPADIVLIMSATQALQLSMMVNTLGNDDFPSLTMKGGTLRGFPVIVSEHLTALGSPSTQMIVAVKASDVYLADDGVVTVDASDQASLEMLDSSLLQSGISGTGAATVSLWQSGLLGIKATREVTWKLRRSTAVQYLSPCAYVTQ